MNKKRKKIDTPLIEIENTQMHTHSKEGEHSKTGFKERELTESRKNMKR